MLENIEPKSVFRYFEEISHIPRGSYNEDAIRDYLITFADDRGLECHKDNAGNVIIIKEATSGYENKEPIILQGHMDMVCDKDADIKKDMEREGIDLEIVDGYVTAKGTTLGGDDGIALAYGLAILDSNKIKHPRLEVIFTVCEEVGMDGARGLDTSYIRGKKLINIDSEEEGVLTVGCAGGGRISVNLSVKREECNYSHVFLSVSGLLGGHSGSDINLGRASSYSLLVRIYKAIYEKMDMRFVEFSTGNLINVISNSAVAEIAVANAGDCIRIIEELTDEIKEEYKETDSKITIKVEEKESGMMPLTQEDTIKVSTILASMPQGVTRMSDDFEDAVETSINWGVCEVKNDVLVMKGLVRSQLDDRAYELLNRVSWIAKGNGAKAEIDSNYPAWQYNKESVLCSRMCSIYKELFDKEEKIEVIHAGLECGFFVDKIEGLDAVSMGPDILDIHTSNERLDIESVGRTWDFLLRVLEES